MKKGRSKSCKVLRKPEKYFTMKKCCYGLMGFEPGSLKHYQPLIQLQCAGALASQRICSASAGDTDPKTEFVFKIFFS